MNFWCTRGEQTIYDKTFVFRVKLDFILCFYFHQFSLLAGISFWWLCVFFLNYSCQKLSSYLYARAHTFTCKNECIVKWHLFIYLLNSTHSLMLCVKVWFLFVAVAEDEGKKGETVNTAVTEEIMRVVTMLLSLNALTFFPFPKVLYTLSLWFSVYFLFSVRKFAVHFGHFSKHAFIYLHQI